MPIAPSPQINALHLAATATFKSIWVRKITASVAVWPQYVVVGRYRLSLWTAAKNHCLVILLGMRALKQHCARPEAAHWPVGANSPAPHSSALMAARLPISMDGCGPWMDTTLPTHVPSH